MGLRVGPKLGFNSDGTLSDVSFLHSFGLWKEEKYPYFTDALTIDAIVHDIGKNLPAQMDMRAQVRNNYTEKTIFPFPSN